MTSKEFGDDVGALVAKLIFDKSKSAGHGDVIHLQEADLAAIIATSVTTACDSLVAGRKQARS